MILECVLKNKLDLSSTNKQILFNVDYIKYKIKNIKNLF